MEKFDYGSREEVSNLGWKKMSPCTLEELLALLLATWRKVFFSARIFHKSQTQEERGFQIRVPRGQDRVVPHKMCCVNGHHGSTPTAPLKALTCWSVLYPGAVNLSATLCMSQAIAQRNKIPQLGYKLVALVFRMSGSMTSPFTLSVWNPVQNNRDMKWKPREILPRCCSYLFFWWIMVAVFQDLCLIS